MFEGQHSPDLVLALFSPFLAGPQPDWPAQTQVTGFIPFADVTPLPVELEKFLNDGPPPLVFTLGSDSATYAGQFFLESLSAAAYVRRRAVLAGDGVGQFRAMINEVGMAGEAIAVDYVPYATMFRRAAIVVHHGGIGTAAIALRAGRPMLAVPGGHDQPDNTARLIRIGVARAIARPAYTAPAAAVELSQLLTDNRYAARAEEIAFAMRYEDGAAAASDLIEQRLKKQTA
jgi:UDP:flavonoid glycosyltransferase YjiC (YdhE family)